MLNKNLKHFVEKSLIVFEVLKGGPFEHTKTYFHKMFFYLFFTFQKKSSDSNSGFVSQKYACNKKEIKF